MRNHRPAAADCRGEFRNEFKTAESSRHRRQDALKEA
jgi:hypothetical protein